MRTKKQQELEEKLILEEYNPVTLEELAENEQLLLEKANDENGKIQPTQMVKTAYGKIDNGYATVREHLRPIAIIVFFVFLFAVPILFLTFFIINKWWES